MKAKVAPRINQKRTPLEHVIPLDTPYVLFLDPSSRCNFKCKFCPTGDRKLIRSTGRFQGLIAYQDFCRVIDDLDGFKNAVKVLRLYKDGEPLLNNDLDKMVAYANQSKKIESIDMTTNGALLMPRISEGLIAAGIDRINISINGLSQQQFYEFAGVRIDFEKYLKNIRYLYQIKGDCQIVIKTVSEVIGQDQRQLFYDLFGNYCDQVYIENLAPCWPEFDVEDRLDVKIDRGIYGNSPEELDVCAYLFYSMSINSDLKASACFLDWRRELTIGDLGKESIVDIWNGDKLNAHRWAHLKRMRYQHKACGVCGQLSHCQADNIDGHRQALEKRLLKPETASAAAVLNDYGQYSQVGKKIDE